MKIINCFIIAFAAAAITSSCAMDDTTETTTDNSAKQSVTIRIANVTSPDPSTRGTQGAYTGASVNVATVSSLRAIFAAGDDILQVVELATPVTASAADNTFWWERAADEGLYKFHMLPAGVDKVAITNLPATDAVTLASVKTAAQGALPANWQGAQNVPVWGESLAANWTEVGTDEHPVGVDGVAYKYYNAGTVTVASLLATMQFINFRFGLSQRISTP